MYFTLFGAISMKGLWEELCNLIAAEGKQYDIRNDTENRH